MQLEIYGIVGVCVCVWCTSEINFQMIVFLCVLFFFFLSAACVAVHISILVCLFSSSSFFIIRLVQHQIDCIANETESQTRYIYLLQCACALWPMLSPIHTNEDRQAKRSQNASILWPLERFCTSVERYKPYITNVSISFDPI